MTGSRYCITEPDDTGHEISFANALWKKAMVSGVRNYNARWYDGRNV